MLPSHLGASSCHASVLNDLTPCEGLGKTERFAEVCASLCTRGDLGKAPDFGLKDGRLLRDKSTDRRFSLSLPLSLPLSP